MVIVEGPDGSGKTTLCNELCRDLELEYMRYPGLSSVEGPVDDGIIQWWNEHIAAETEAVFDRCFYISERMYQPATANRALIAKPQTMMDGIHSLWIADPVIVFCMTDWTTEEPIIQSQGRAKLDNVTLEGFTKIHWSYWGEYAMWREMVDHVYHYDYRTDKAYETLLGRLA